MSPFLPISSSSQDPALPTINSLPQQTNSSTDFLGGPGQTENPESNSSHALLPITESLNVGSEKELEATNGLFTRMNSIVMRKAPANSKLVEAIAGKHNDYVLFGELRLPALPSTWSVLQVAAWASKNGATEAILELIKS
ncbi:hypothetical protein BCR33DRAFT_719166, partial [Rhizoclosmatium globosum]